jgi:hypothetical protein
MSKAIDYHIKKYIEGCSAYDAINLLCEEFGKGQSTITFLLSGQRREIRSFLTAQHLAALQPDDLGPIEFWGGPPNKRASYKGTILTMLCDAVLYSFALHGYYAEMVQGSQHEQEKNEAGLYSDGIPF